MSDTASMNGRAFHPRLESARGIAALMVAFLHIGQARWSEDRLLVGVLPEPDDTIWHVLYRVLADGHGAVLFFFVLSGFVLTPSLMRRDLPFAAMATRFALARIGRIWPAAAFTLLVFTILFAATGQFLSAAFVYKPWNLFLNFLLVRTNVNGVMWTLTTELLAVPVLLLAVVFHRLGGWLLVVAYAAILVGVLQFSGSTFARMGFTTDWLIKTNYLYAFVFGMLARPIGAWVIARTPRPAIVALAIFWLCVFFILPEYLGRLSTWGTVAKVTAASGLVAILAFAPIGGMARLLDTTPVRLTGRISFSFYLLHPLTLIVAWNMKDTLGSLVAAGTSPPLIAFVMGVASCVAVAPFAYLMWRYVEIPGVTLSRRLLDKHAGPARDGAASVGTRPGAQHGNA